MQYSLLCRLATPSVLSFDFRNAKVSCAPLAINSSYSSVTKIQEFISYSIRIVFLYGCRGETWWTVEILCNSSSFVTMLNGLDLFGKKEFKVMLTLGSNSLFNVFICDSLTCSNLIVHKMFMWGIGKLCDGMMLKFWSKWK